MALKKVGNMYIAYEINLWLFTVDKEFALGDSILGAVELTKNAELTKRPGFCSQFPH